MADRREPPPESHQAEPTARGVELFRSWFDHSPFTQQLALRIESITPDRADLLMPFDETRTTYDDVVHGGAISALIDVAATAAAWSGAATSATLRGATVGLSIQLLSAGRGDLRASAQTLRRGGTICFCDVMVCDADGAPVARALVTYKLR